MNKNTNTDTHEEVLSMTNTQIKGWAGERIADLMKQYDQGLISLPELEKALKSVELTMLDNGFMPFSVSVPVSWVHIGGGDRTAKMIFDQYTKGMDDPA